MLHHSEKLGLKLRGASVSAAVRGRDAHATTKRDAGFLVDRALREWLESAWGSLAFSQTQRKDPAIPRTPSRQTTTHRESQWHDGLGHGQSREPHEVDKAHHKLLRAPRVDDGLAETDLRHGGRIRDRNPSVRSRSSPGCPSRPKRSAAICLAAQSRIANRKRRGARRIPMSM